MAELLVGTSACAGLAGLPAFLSGKLKILDFRLNFSFGYAN